MSLLGKPSLETRLATAEENHTKASGALTALRNFLATAFNLGDEQKTTVANGDFAPITAAVAARGQPFKDLCAQLVTAFKVSADKAAAFFTGGDESPLMKAIGALQADSAALANVRSWLGKALELKPEDVVALDETKLTEAVNAVAGKKAVAIAAAQGVPPVPTDPAKAGDAKDEIRMAFETAAAEKDPIKRAQLFAAASKLVDQKTKKKDN